MSEEIEERLRQYDKYLENRLRRSAKESESTLVSVLPSEVVKLLDNRDARITELEELLEQAKTTLIEKNAKILDLKQNKGIEELKQALENAANALSNAQGEWSSVSAAYAPGWTHELKSVENECRAMLEDE